MKPFTKHQISDELNWGLPTSACKEVKELTTAVANDKTVRYSNSTKIVNTYQYWYASLHK